VVARLVASLRHCPRCDSVTFVRARSLGLRPKENPNRERQNSSRILFIASDAARRTICTPRFGRNTGPPHSTPNRFRTGNRSRDFATLRPYRGPLKGGKCSRNCRRIVYRAGEQYRAATRYRGERSTGSNPHTNQVHPSAAPTGVQTPVWFSPLMIVRPFPQSDLDRFGNPQPPYGRHHFEDGGEIPRISARPSA
jgi:hypothetical protein